MSWFRDLDRYAYIPDTAAEDSKLVAVGWLEKGQPYTTGEVRDDIVDKLLTLLVDPWQPAVSAGHHRCSFCRISGGPGGLNHLGQLVKMGNLNLFVPGAGCIYVAPSSIPHYIDAHEYWPPVEFCDAVLACPDMRTPEYLRAILANGGRGLVPPRKPRE